MTFKDIFPPIGTAMELEPEELAPFVLKYLSTQPNINRYNFTLGTSPDQLAYTGAYNIRFNERLMEAWVWLERELMVAPQPGTKDDWAFITRKGQKVLEAENFAAYKKESLLPSEGLDPILVKKVKPLFIRGDYDTAVFQSFKEVEVRVRKMCGLPASDIGVKLMRKAFGSPDGILTDKKVEGGEQTATMELFTGAIGLYKNPSSHREVEFTDPNEVSDIVHTANQLLRILDRIKVPKPA